MTAVEARLLLSDKEFRAMELKNQGRKRSEIAAEMGVSNHRVDQLLYKSKQKLGKYYQNYKVFSPRVYPASSHTLKIVNSTEKETLLDEINYGKSKLAYNILVKYDLSEMKTPELRLSSAINGVGERSYLLKKRREARNALTMSARYDIVKLTGPVGKTVAREIEYNRLNTIKTDFDELEDGTPITTYSILCKSAADLDNLIRAVRSSTKA